MVSVSGQTREHPQVEVCRVIGLGAALRDSGVHLVGEPLPRCLARDTERDRDLVPRSAVSPGELDGLSQPCFGVTDGLRSLGDSAKVVGDQDPGGLGLELLGELLEAFCRACDLFVRVSHLHPRP